jgi:ubiquinone/menaquinone biosynthesis C-methylase UbiE
MPAGDSLVKGRKMTIADASRRSHGPVWALGDYTVIGTTLQIVAEELCEAVDLRGGQRVLDIATGSGNAAISAARRACEVVGIDYAQPLLHRGRARALSEGVCVSFVGSDAECLPFPDNSFDVVLSTFGVMFAPHHAQAAAEVSRVCRPGGKIGMANWTPEGVFGQSSKVIAAFIPPASNHVPPSLWGTADYLDQLFANQVEVSSQKRTVMYRYPSVEQYFSTLRNTYPPFINLFQNLDTIQQEKLGAALCDLYQSRNDATDGTFLMSMEYLEVVAQKI